ncbi:MAG: DegT/DnrJ/EryC1/StrS family aminotransferase [Myxococcota bacterium]
MSLAPILPLPTLWPSQLWPKRQQVRPFPLGHPGLWTTYLARNAVHRAVRALGLAGSEVVVPAYHHGVEVEALLAAGALVRFARLNARAELDLDDVERRIGPRTRALYVIHYAGFPQPLGALVELARRHHLALLEDCALALFSHDGERPLGSVGEAAIFCFYKTLPVPHGGALLLRRTDAEEGASSRAPPLLSTLSSTTGSLLMSVEGQLGRAGTVVRNALRQVAGPARRRALKAAVPVGTQTLDLRVLDVRMSRLTRWLLGQCDAGEVVRRRRENWSTLHRHLGPERTPWPTLPVGVCPLFYGLRVRDRDEALAKLRERGVQAIDFWRIGHPSVPKGLCAVTDSLRREVIELPCHQDLGSALVERIGQAARELP